MDGNNDTKRDDLKMTHTKTTVMGATLEKAPTPPNVSTAADNSLKVTMMETTVMGGTTSGKAMVPEVIGKKKMLLFLISTWHMPSIILILFLKRLWQILLLLQ
jgi:hypothetical protein